MQRDEKRAGAPKDPGLCHDVTPWTHHNRVPLCQATLSIGPYLLLKVQFQHHFITQISQLKPEKPELDKVPGLADRWSVLNYDPHGMDDPRDIAEERQKNVNPEVLTDPHLQKHPQRGEKNRDHEAQ